MKSLPRKSRGCGNSDWKSIEERAEPIQARLEIEVRWLPRRSGGKCIADREGRGQLNSATRKNEHCFQINLDRRSTTPTELRSHGISPSKNHGRVVPKAAKPLPPFPRFNVTHFFPSKRLPQSHGSLFMNPSLNMELPKKGSIPHVALPWHRPRPLPRSVLISIIDGAEMVEIARTAPCLVTHG